MTTLVLPNNPLLLLLLLQQHNFMRSKRKGKEQKNVITIS